MVPVMTYCGVVGMCCVLFAGWPSQALATRNQIYKLSLNLPNGMLSMTLSYPLWRWRGRWRWQRIFRCGRGNILPSECTTSASSPPPLPQHQQFQKLVTKTQVHIYSTTTTSTPVNTASRNISMLQKHQKPPLAAYLCRLPLAATARRLQPSPRRSIPDHENETRACFVQQQNPPESQYSQLPIISQLELRHESSRFI